jgi:hypothetical protein
MLEEESFAFAEDRTPVVQSVVRQYTELPCLLGNVQRKTLVG